MISFLAAFLATPVVLQDEVFELDAQTQAFLSQLNFEEGTVQLSTGEAEFTLPEGWAFLQSEGARRVVEEYWGNPEDTSTLGFIDPPSNAGRLQSSWGIIVSAEFEGYISDEDAGGLDFDEIMRDEKKTDGEANEWRVENGFEPIETVGWAEQPHYDATTNKLYWAKELRFGDAPENTLNYDVRILGRRGALVLTAVAGMSDFAEVQEGMKLALDNTSFLEGHRYSDFDSSLDKVAAYGIGGLVAGKLAAKVGLLAVIGKFAKVIVLGIVGALVAAKKFLLGKKTAEPETAPEA